MKDGRPVKLLLVEDNAGDARLMRAMLDGAGMFDFEITRQSCLEAALSHLAGTGADIILLDLGLPDATGLDAMRQVQEAAPRTPLVVLTGWDNDALAAQALREGAQDYLIKGELEPRGLLRALRYAIDRKVMADTLFLEKERAEVTLSSIGDAVACTDHLGMVTFLNGAAEKMAGLPWQRAIGQPIDAVFPLRGGMPGLDGQAAAQAGLLVSRLGEEIPVEYCASSLRGHDGAAAGAVLVFRDVSSVRAAERELVRLAQHDFLTGLPNRLLLGDRISQAIAQAARYERKVGILFLDLDGFKHINDMLGHDIGDKVLQAVARRLAECVRSADTVSRLGGDEFIVLLAEMGQAEDATIAANRLLQAVRVPYHILHHELHLTTSIGISLYPEDGMDAETLIRNADTALYKVKEEGRQNFRFFEPAMNARHVERQFIKDGLWRAAESGQFALHYQPKIDLGTGQITSAEALLRWTHPQRGPISPLEFISVAEDSGLIVPVGEWVLSEACRQVKAWADEGLPALTIAVNVSASQFSHGEFLGSLFGILNKTGLDPKYLELEMTESVLMKSTPLTLSVLRTLRSEGLRLAVDDFGTGYSSLSYLNRFPIDTLKIDQSFVGQITAQPPQTTIVSAVIGMAKNLNLRVVAEGVETQGQLKFLQDQNCDEAQGFYFTRPLPAQKFHAWMQEYAKRN
jgi:diguanylate cyclase (GGDEF)-like protein